MERKTSEAQIKANKKWIEANKEKNNLWWEYGLGLLYGGRCFKIRVIWFI